MTSSGSPLGNDHSPALVCCLSSRLGWLALSPVLDGDLGFLLFSHHTCFPLASYIWTNSSPHFFPDFHPPQCGNHGEEMLFCFFLMFSECLSMLSPISQTFLCSWRPTLQPDLFSWPGQVVIPGSFKIPGSCPHLSVNHPSFPGFKDQTSGPHWYDLLHLQLFQFRLFSESIQYHRSTVTYIEI